MSTKTIMRVGVHERVSLEVTFSDEREERQNEVFYCHDCHRHGQTRAELTDQECAPQPPWDPKWDSDTDN